MFCSKCGKEIADGSKFCKYCGNDCVKVSEKQPIYCPKCAGQGFYRSTAKMIISVIVVFMMLISMSGFYLLFGRGEVILFLALLAVILYFGFKKGECPVCHGSGRLYR